MNILKTLATAVVGAIVEQIPNAVQAISKALRKSEPEKRKPMWPHHNWEIYEPGASLVKLKTPFCIYCRTPQTLQNKEAPCFGPDIPKRTS
jgi:hypothetical protein